MIFPQNKGQLAQVDGREVFLDDSGNLQEDEGEKKTSDKEL